MIDEKKIKPAAQGYCDATYGTLDNHPFIAEGFRQGAKWAIQEFFKELWHDAKEEPKGFSEQLLLWMEVGDFTCYSIHQPSDFKSWSNFVKQCPVKKWLYIDDLLPKEGGSDD